MELPERPSVQRDEQIVETLAVLAEQLFARSPRVFDELTGGKGRSLIGSRSGSLTAISGRR